MYLSIENFIFLKIIGVNRILFGKTTLSIYLVAENTRVNRPLQNT